MKRNFKYTWKNVLGFGTGWMNPSISLLDNALKHLDKLYPPTNNSKYFQQTNRHSIHQNISQFIIIFSHFILEEKIAAAAAQLVVVEHFGLLRHVFLFLLKISLIIN